MNITEILATANIKATIIYFIIGAFLGSFYNVIAMRSIREESWVKGRSKCDTCGHTLGLTDLIPIVSYIAHKGKCKYCKSKIPIQHLISEIGFGLSLAIMQPSILGLIVLSVLWINVMSDITAKLTITSVTYVGILIVLILTTLKYGFGTETLVSIALIAVVLLANRIFYNKDHAFGLGDIDILLLLEVYGGILYPVKVLGIGCLAGFIVLVPLLVTRKIDGKSEIPLVPFIYLGVIIGAMV